MFLLRSLFKSCTNANYCNIWLHSLYIRVEDISSNSKIEILSKIYTNTWINLNSCIICVCHQQFIFYLNFWINKLTRGPKGSQSLCGWKDFCGLTKNRKISSSHQVAFNKFRCITHGYYGINFLQQQNFCDKLETVIHLLSSFKKTKQNIFMIKHRYFKILTD